MWQEAAIDAPLKIVRVGVTESALILLLAREGRWPRDMPFMRSKMWHAWNSIGFYDSRFAAPQTRDDVDWDRDANRTLRDYFAAYHAAVDNADIIIHLQRSILDVEEQFDGDVSDLELLYHNLPSPPRTSVDIFRYTWVNEHCEGRNVVVVSPFAALMRQQATRGNLARLRPDFRPRQISFFGFPYCFANEGPHANSFETVDWAITELKRVATTDTVFLFSCGSMGVLIQDALHRAGSHVMYCGGALQLFFGIMGGRWRSGRPDDAIDPADRLLDSFTNHPEWWVDEIPAEHIPKHALRVENGCYW